MTVALPSARAATPTAPRGTRAPRPTAAGEALALLRAGSIRWAAERQRHPHDDAGRRRAVAVAQHPFAVVLGCIDSRVPPELVFDQGLGDLMVIRSAGQALDEAVLGSIQYGVEELHIPLVLVLGHERCGAVSATVDHVRTGRPATGHLSRVIDDIAPSARATQHLPGDWVENTVRANVARIRRTLAADPAFEGAVVAGARFDLDTGKVCFDRI
ncbi:carbonic anhydrase [Streptomyces sp. NPDC054841]